MKVRTDKYTIKWIKLGILIISGFILSYILAFSKTIEKYKQNNEYNAVLIELIEKPKIIASLEKKRKENQNKIIKDSGLDSLASRQKMLDLFSNAAEKFRFSIKEVSPAFYSSIDTLNAELSVYTLEGNYIDLIKTWNFIETQMHFGTIISSRFYIAEDFRLNIKKLNLVLYVELLKNKAK